MRSRWLLLVAVVVFAIACACLIVLAFGPDEVQASVDAWGMFGGLVLVPIEILTFALLPIVARITKKRIAWLALWIPCALAPLATLPPWFIAPSHLGMGFMGLPSFVFWLTRYPNLGSINYEVALGIGAMLGACALPAFAAMYTSAAKRPRFTFVFVVLHWIAYVPVLVRLDIETATMAIAMGIHGPISIFGEAHLPWWQNALVGLVAGAGVLVRAFAAIAMVPLAMRALRQGNSKV